MPFSLKGYIFGACIHAMADLQKGFKNLLNEEGDVTKIFSFSHITIVAG